MLERMSKIPLRSLSPTRVLLPTRTMTEAVAARYGHREQPDAGDVRATHKDLQEHAVATVSV